MRIITLLVLLLSGFGAFCQGSDDFFSQLAARKGKTFYGKAVYMPDTVKSNDFWGKKLAFTVESVSAGQLRIPFDVGTNKSRTWIITKTGETLQLKHDHRHDDGSPDSITNYGGISDREKGTARVQYFPADEFTAKLLPAARTNRWIMQFSEDGRKFYYILERDQVMRFKAEFDLR